jgi:hypothetical protein
MANQDVKSARFNRNNPQERKVLEIIEKAEDAGTSFKDLVMTIILDAEGIVTESPLSVAKELSDTVSEMKSLLSELQKGGHITAHNPPVQRTQDTNEVSVDDSLVESILNNRKQGRRRTQ